MADPIRCVCPHCGTRLRLADANLAGETIDCPECDEPFVVKLLDDDRPARRTRRDDEDRVPRRPKGKKAKKSGSGLLPLLVGGGVVLLIAVVALVVANKKGLFAKRDPAGPAAATPDVTPAPLPLAPPAPPPPPVNPDFLVNILAPFPDPGPFRGGFVAKPEETLTFHIVIVGVSFKADHPKVLEGVTEYFTNKMKTVIDGKDRAGVGRSVDAPDGTAILQTVKLAPVTEDLAALAQKIDFGTVRSVSDRTITVVFRSEAVPLGPEYDIYRPPPAPPNPRTIDPAEVTYGHILVSIYQARPQDADKFFTGKQCLCQIGSLDFVRDADGTACVVMGAEKGTRSPSLVARLANENGWKENAQLKRGVVFVEGRVVGPRPLGADPWARNWTKLPAAFPCIPGKLVVIEDARIVIPVEHQR